MYSNNKDVNGVSKKSYGSPSTGNVHTYSHNEVNHNQRTETINHRTHPDSLQHRQSNSFGK